MSDEESLKKVNDNDLLLLCNCVNHLEAELLKKTCHADEKITFLTLADACLNEMLLC